MTAIKETFGSGGANIAPGGSAGAPDLATTLRDVADDLAALQPSAVATPDAGGTYGANEQALINELKAKVDALAAAVLLTTKA